MPFDAVRPKNLIGKLSVPLRKQCDIDAATLFSVVLKTADGVGLTMAPANGLPTKGECVAYMIRHKYRLMRALVAENNFTSTFVLYFLTRYLPLFLLVVHKKILLGFPNKG